MKKTKNANRRWNGLLPGVCSSFSSECIKSLQDQCEHLWSKRAVLIYAYVSAEKQLGFYPQLSNIVTGKLSNMEVSNSFLLLHSDRPQDEPLVSSQAFYLISEYFLSCQIIMIFFIIQSHSGLCVCSSNYIIMHTLTLKRTPKYCHM